MSAAELPRWTVVVGAGGVGKTTVASALGVASARAGARTLVITFDPSRRLKDALGVGESAVGGEVQVPVEPADGQEPGELWASVLDGKATFDALVERHSPTAADHDRILENRYYAQLAGSLSGVLEYMAVERLFEIEAEGRFDRIVLDTPPTSEALDFLDAPERVVSFLDSKVLAFALKPWFDREGRLVPVRRLGRLGNRLTGWLDRIVGIELLADMAEFFQAFTPLYAGFRERAAEVRELLTSEEAGFVLVSASGRGRMADTRFFARGLHERGHPLAAVVLNRLHPSPLAERPRTSDEELIFWRADRDRRAASELRELLAGSCPLWTVPLLADEPRGLSALVALATLLEGQLRPQD